MNWETWEPVRIGDENTNSHIECSPSDACDLAEWE